MFVNIDITKENTNIEKYGDILFLTSGSFSLRISEEQCNEIAKHLNHTGEPITHSDFYEGAVMYRVTKYLGYNIIEKVIITSKPYHKSSDAYFVNALLSEIDGSNAHSDWFSLRDFNVPENSYNEHRLFRTEIQAIKYRLA
jgi:hypothetical protein